MNMWAISVVLTLLVTCWSRSTEAGVRKSSNFFYAPGFRIGGPLGPQHSVDGLWTFIAVPIPLENQTLPEGDFPTEQVAQAKLWGPIYRSGHGWVYGEAGFILVPRIPPYVPPTILPPPRPMSNGGTPPPAVAEISGTGSDSGVQPVRSAPSAPAGGAAPSEAEDPSDGTDGKSDIDTKQP